MIDLTPDDLIRRLKEGKVYVPRNADRALAHYFSKGNLTALRELALRRTAQRVDEQLLTHMRANAIAGPWAAGERILVCINEDRRAPGLVRYAKRLADLMHAPWTALSVESRRHAQLSEPERDHVAETMRLAQRLGGDTLAIPSAERRIADDVLAFAHENNVTQIVIGKAPRSRLFEILHGSVVHDLTAEAGDISVHVIAGDAEPDTKPSAGSKAGAARDYDPWGFIWAAVATGVALGVNHLMRPFVGPDSVPLVFLTAIVAVAVRYGLWPSLIAVALASLAYNFFFLPPLYTFTIADPTNIAALCLFALVAFLVSNLTARARHQAVALKARARTTEALYNFSRKLAGCATLNDVLWATVYQIATMLKHRVVVLLPGAGGLAVGAGYPPEDALDAADVAAARWAFENDSVAGRGRGYAARRQTALPADAYGPRRHRRGRFGQRQARSAAHPRTAASARRPVRPGRSRHGTCSSGRRSRSGGARLGDRSFAPSRCSRPSPTISRRRSQQSLAPQAHYRILRPISISLIARSSLRRFSARRND